MIHKTVKSLLTEACIKTEISKGPGHFDFANTLMCNNFIILEDPEHTFWDGNPQIIIKKYDKHMEEQINVDQE